VADIFIVPYAATAHCACDNNKARCLKVTNEDIQENVLAHLDYLDSSTWSKHVFFSSVQRELNHPFMKDLPLVVTLEVKSQMCKPGNNCWHIFQPYVNTNADFQPNSRKFLATHSNNSLDKREYAISAFMSGDIWDPKETAQQSFSRQ
jgi:hypothetical protein